MICLPTLPSLNHDLPHTSALLKLAKLLTTLLDFLRLVDCVPMATATGDARGKAIGKKKNNKMSMQGERPPAAAEVDSSQVVEFDNSWLTTPPEADQVVQTNLVGAPAAAVDNVPAQPGQIDATTALDNVLMQPGQIDWRC